MRTARLLCAALGLATMGCYSYQPIGLAELRRDMQLRARLSASLTEEVREFLPAEDRLIEGAFIENASDHLLLLVPVTHATRRGRVETLNQRLRLPHDGVLEIELRELDRVKTGTMSAAAAVLVGLVLYQTLQKGSSGNNPGGPGGPEDSIIPFRITIGWD